MDEKWRREVLSKHFFGTWRCKLREKTLFSQLRSDGGPKIGVKSYAACLRADRVCLHNSCSSGKSLAAHGWNWKIVSWQHLFGFVMNASLKGAWNTWPWSHLNTRLCFSLFSQKFQPCLGFCFLRGTFIHVSIANTVWAWGFIRNLLPPQSVRSLFDLVKQGELWQTLMSSFLVSVVMMQSLIILLWNMTHD